MDIFIEIISESNVNYYLDTNRANPDLSLFLNTPGSMTNYTN